MKRVVAIAVSDLLFQSRIEGAVRSLGLEAVIADTPHRLDDALARRPAAAVVDVHERAFSAEDAIARAAEAGAGVLAFGRHTAPAELRAARAAGASVVVPRSELVERMLELIEQVVAPQQDAKARDSASL